LGKVGVAGPFAQGRGMLELSPAAAAFFVMAFPAHCLVGQMPHARFVGMLSVTRKGLEINSTLECINQPLYVSQRFNVRIDFLRADYQY